MLPLGFRFAPSFETLLSFQLECAGFGTDR
jgi:hypothetical protein